MDWNYDTLAKQAGDDMNDAMDNGRDKGDDHCGVWRRDKTTCISILTDEGYRLQPAQQCHIALDGSYDEEIDGLRRLGVVCAIMDGNHEDDERCVDEDVGIPFLDWLACRSPYAPGFVSKDARKMWDQQYSVHTAEVASNLMAGGMVAKRRLWEYSQVVDKWSELVKRGANENMAFLMAHHGYVDDGKFSINGVADSHVSVSTDTMRHISVNNFVKGYVSKPLPLYHEDLNCWSINKLWADGRERGNSFRKEVEKRFNKLANPVAVVNVNPFPVGEDEDVTEWVDYDEAMSHLTTICNELMEDWCNA